MRRRDLILIAPLALVGWAAWGLLAAHPAAAEAGSWQPPGLVIPDTGTTPMGNAAASWAPPNLVIPDTGPTPLIENPTPPEPPPVVNQAPAIEVPPALAPPVGTGGGKRIVYSNSRQRVWWYDEDGRLIRTYLVSGRRGTPRSGTYSVFSRSRVSRAGRVRLDWMVRFARGRSLAIGFHAIPVGRRGPIQSDRELGQFRSHGCVRQSRQDAEALWTFAGLGTRVVVTA